MNNMCLTPKLIPIALLAVSFLVPAPKAQALPATAGSTANMPVPNTLEEARIANQNAQAAYYRSQTAAPTKHELSPWLGAVLPLLGLVLGSVLTYLVAARQSSETQDRLYKRQEIQVRAAVRDLMATLESLRLQDNQKLAFLQESFLVEQPGRPERPKTFNRRDPYYQKYDFVNLVYRLCAVLGWMELYRVDPTFLNGPAKDKRRIEESFRAIRRALSADFEEEKKDLPVPGDGTSSWADGVILDDDQRAIGKTMLTPATDNTPPAVFGYGAFCVSLFRFAKKEGEKIKVGDQNFWIWNATRFIVDMGQVVSPNTDFRRQRLAKVLSALCNLDGVLTRQEITEKIRQALTLDTLPPSAEKSTKRIERSY